MSGTLRIYYNPRLHTISGLGAVSRLRNLEISQNANLTQISGLTSLEMIRGYLQIDHNQKLVNLDGLSNLRSIGGADLVAGHALNILYNPSLSDLRWLQNFTRIESGTVHIEGNSGLCYAGYPQWAEGGFELRPPAGDRGVDWRRLLGPGVPRWQYSWGAEGYPTLLIQNNARYEDCSKSPHRILRRAPSHNHSIISQMRQCVMKPVKKELDAWAPQTLISVAHVSRVFVRLGPHQQHHLVTPHPYHTGLRPSSHTLWCLAFSLVLVVWFCWGWYCWGGG